MSTLSDPLVILDRVSKSYNSGIETVRAVREIGLRAYSGQFLCIYGASGSGKSTFINLVAGLDTPDSGNIIVSGIDVANAKEGQRARMRLKNVGVIFQEHNLIDEFTAEENVSFPLEVRGLNRAEASTAAQHALLRVGLDHEMDRFPRQMSGGQRQRVGIARAIVGNRRIVLADEPTGSLDSRNSRDLFELLRHLCDQGALVIVCSHDPMCENFADVVYEMNDGALDVRKPRTRALS